mmetsp:Transcript_34129/g.55635  ORF Transcript_34129/g.55635 Transcript_34129/m.55635 type:complete len:234 (-) Transcript_34129:80-781(-)|eukprot:CAMPEP_0202694934 /NCGR_PEP_ID=MMETSP1385-20130828/8661_1 /ASSEMBLY_ACC=CAM_ASM_000861 /TAXON_ID=933848 /ORGANISM="Elphidium margaritaceum" /LENGTH=233 /DNA_ID=CAMNT_0049350873 /DNA_START=30 /DNA_END=731 /DNA_ORIENTATION=-
MGCKQSAPQGDEASANIKELQVEIERLKQELKTTQKKLSKYEKKQTLSPNKLELAAVPSHSGGLADSQPSTPLPENRTLMNEEEEIDDEPSEAALDPHPERPAPPQKAEKSKFWVDVKKEIDNIDHQKIKRQIPHQDFIDEDDDRWKMLLWKTDYGKYELQCIVQLVSYNTGQWTEEEVEQLYKIVSQNGLNTRRGWEKTAESLNREVDDVMNKYSELVGTPLKQLQKMSTRR